MFSEWFKNLLSELRFMWNDYLSWHWTERILMGFIAFLYLASGVFEWHIISPWWIAHYG